MATELICIVTEFANPTEIGIHWVGEIVVVAAVQVLHIARHCFVVAQQFSKQICFANKKLPEAN